MIPDDDVHQSEGIGGASKQPVVPVEVASSAPANPSPPKGPRDLGLAPVSPIKDFNEDSSRPSPFIPSWNLHSESRLSVRDNDLKFSRHVLPPTATTDMEVMCSTALSHNMTCAIAQAMFYLIVGVWRIQMFSEVEAAHVGCKTRVAELERCVSELSGDL